MQIPVNKDLDSYKDDFFKGLTLKQTALSIVSVAAGTGTFLLGMYVLKLPQSVSFYMALPVVLPIAASGFLQIHGMTPAEYLKRRHSVRTGHIYYFVPGAFLPEEEGKEQRKHEKRTFLLDEEVT